jgi:adenylate cyclase
MRNVPTRTARLPSPTERPVAQWVAVAALLALPVAGLALLLAVPSLDVVWEHHPSHFWLVLSVALVNIVLAVLTSEAATQRNDPRLFLVSLVLLSSAAFLALHALATPGVLLSNPNQGFAIANPIGLILASIFAASSTLPREAGGWGLGPRAQRLLRAALGVVIGAWAIASFAGLSWLSRAPDEEVPTTLRVLSAAAIALYAFAAFRYLQLFLRRGGMLPSAVAVAFVLLAEAMGAVASARSWHATWWEWHVLMAIAFGTILFAARRGYRRERSVTAAFGGLYLERTLERIERRHSEAIGELTAAIRQNDALTPLLERLREQGFSADEVAVLERSARELSRVDTLLRRYVGPQLADRLEDEPGFSRLGGHELDASVLFADLAGFTNFSEGRSPVEVIEMVNAYWERAVPVVVGDEGGLVERFAGDAIMVVFNAMGDEVDHPVRAARAAIGMRAATDEIAREHPGWPRFRIGVHTGLVVIGNVGAGDQRSFAAIGDTTNVAARLQAAARPGQILASRMTVERLSGEFVTTSVGALSLKGKAEPVEAFALV